MAVVGGVGAAVVLAIGAFFGSGAGASSALSSDARALWDMMHATGATAELCHSYLETDDEYGRASFAGGAALAAQQAGIPVSDQDIKDMLDAKC